MISTGKSDEILYKFVWNYYYHYDSQDKYKDIMLNGLNSEFSSQINFDLENVDFSINVELAAQTRN